MQQRWIDKPIKSEKTLANCITSPHNGNTPLAAKFRAALEKK